LSLFDDAQHAKAQLADSMRGLALVGDRPIARDRWLVARQRETDDAESSTILSRCAYGDKMPSAYFRMAYRAFCQHLKISLRQGD
jgi:hypothetical protein